MLLGKGECDVGVVDCCVADDFADVIQEFVAHSTVGFQGKRSERASFSVRKGIILIVLRLFLHVPEADPACGCSEGRMGRLVV